MLDERKSPVLITTEACNYLRISRPTYLKHLATGKIKGIKVGKGWKVLKSELNRFLRGEMEFELFSNAAPQDQTGNPIQRGGLKCAKSLAVRNVSNVDIG